MTRPRIDLAYASIRLEMYGNEALSKRGEGPYLAAENQSVRIVTRHCLCFSGRTKSTAIPKI
jgi:hypothetical protein